MGRDSGVQSTGIVRISCYARLLYWNAVPLRERLQVPLTIPVTLVEAQAATF
jgi:hypothetical protein